MLSMVSVVSMVSMVSVLSVVVSWACTIFDPILYLCVESMECE